MPGDGRQGQGPKALVSGEVLAVSLVLADPQADIRLRIRKNLDALCYRRRLCQSSFEQTSIEDPECVLGAIEVYQPLR